MLHYQAGDVQTTDCMPILTLLHVLSMRSPWLVVSIVLQILFLSKCIQYFYLYLMKKYFYFF